MARPKSIGVVDATQPVAKTENVLQHKAFSIFRDTDGRWYVAVIPYDPTNNTVVPFTKANNFFIPENLASSDDKFEAFEHFKKIFGEYAFGEKSILG